MPATGEVVSMADSNKSERPMDEQVALAGVLGAAVGIITLIGNKVVKGGKK
jgi:hypothetical protein